MTKQQEAGTEPATVGLYEIDIEWEAGDRRGRVQVYRGSRTEAVRVAKGPSTGMIPSGAQVIRCTVYGCTLPALPPVAMRFALLNRAIAPRRASVVYGDIPLPLAAPAAVVDADASKQAPLL